MKINTAKILKIYDNYHVFTQTKIETILMKDGIYEIESGDDLKKIYIKIENGKIVKETNSVNDLLIDYFKLSNMEDSFGINKSLALEIRNKFVLNLFHLRKKIPNWVFKRTDSKFWIENKNNLINLIKENKKC